MPALLCYLEPTKWASSLWHKGAYNRTFPCKLLGLYGIRVLAKQQTENISSYWRSRPMIVKSGLSWTNESGPDWWSVTDWVVVWRGDVPVIILAPVQTAMMRRGIPQPRMRQVEWDNIPTLAQWQQVGQICISQYYILYWYYYFASLLPERIQDLQIQIETLKIAAQGSW